MKKQKLIERNGRQERTHGEIVFAVDLDKVFLVVFFLIHLTGAAGIQCCPLLSLP
jgi:hypothetical protein